MAAQSGSGQEAFDFCRRMIDEEADEAIVAPCIAGCAATPGMIAAISMKGGLHPTELASTYAEMREKYWLERLREMSPEAEQGFARAARGVQQVEPDSLHKDDLRYGMNSVGFGSLAMLPESGAHKMAEFLFDERCYSRVLAVSSVGAWFTVAREDGWCIRASDAFSVASRSGYVMRGSNGRTYRTSIHSWRGPFFSQDFIESAVNREDAGDQISIWADIPACLPMAHGICRSGFAVNDTKWVLAAEATCGELDAHHRKNAYPEGGEGCVNVYNAYAEPCCVRIPCPPMVNGICRSGFAVNDSKWVWSQVRATEVTCGELDAHHRTNADPEGGEECVNVYNAYAEPCCVRTPCPPMVNGICRSGFALVDTSQDQVGQETCGELDARHRMTADPNGGEGCANVYRKYEERCCVQKYCPPMVDGICGLKGMLASTDQVEGVTCAEVDAHYLKYGDPDAKDCNDVLARYFRPCCVMTFPCPPMPSGICRSGSTLLGTNRVKPLVAQARQGMVTCEEADAFHRVTVSADLHCYEVQNYYAESCCVRDVLPQETESQFILGARYSWAWYGWAQAEPWRGSPVASLTGGWELYLFVGGDAVYKDELRYGANAGGYGYVGSLPKAGGHKMAEAFFDERCYKAVLALGSDGAWAMMQRMDNGCIEAKHAFSDESGDEYYCVTSDGHYASVTMSSFLSRMWLEDEEAYVSRKGRVLGGIAKQNYTWAWFGRTSPPQIPTFVNYSVTTTYSNTYCMGPEIHTIIAALKECHLATDDAWDGPVYVSETCYEGRVARRQYRDAACTAQLAPVNVSSSNCRADSEDAFFMTECRMGQMASISLSPVTIPGADCFGLEEEGKGYPDEIHVALGVCLRSTWWHVKDKGYMYTCREGNVVLTKFADRLCADVLDSAVYSTEACIAGQLHTNWGCDTPPVEPGAVVVQTAVEGLKYGPLHNDTRLARALETGIQSWVATSPPMNLTLGSVSVRLNDGFGVIKQSRGGAAMVMEATAVIPRGSPGEEMLLVVRAAVDKPNWTNRTSELVENVRGIGAARVEDVHLSVDVASVILQPANCTNANYKAFGISLCNAPEWDQLGCGSVIGAHGASECGGKLLPNVKEVCGHDGCKVAVGASMASTTCRDYCGMQDLYCRGAWWSWGGLHCSTWLHQEVSCSSNISTEVATLRSGVICECSPTNLTVHDKDVATEVTNTDRSADASGDADVEGDAEICPSEQCCVRTPCPPMVDGICRSGFVLLDTNLVGEVTCHQLDAHHRTNGDLDGGEGCVDVYNAYAEPCCVPAPCPPMVNGICRSGYVLVDSNWVGETTCAALDSLHRLLGAPDGGAGCVDVYEKYAEPCCVKASCPPMINGICRRGFELIGTNQVGEATCDKLDAHYRKIGNRNGGCDDVYSKYGEVCCVPERCPPMPNGICPSGFTLFDTNWVGEAACAALDILYRQFGAREVGEGCLDVYKKYTEPCCLPSPCPPMVNGICRSGFVLVGSNRVGERRLKGEDEGGESEATSMTCDQLDAHYREEGDPDGGDGCVNVYSKYAKSCCVRKPCPTTANGICPSGSVLVGTKWFGEATCEEVDAHRRNMSHNHNESDNGTKRGERQSSGRGNTTSSGHSIDREVENMLNLVEENMSETERARKDAEDMARHCWELHDFDEAVCDKDLKPCWYNSHDHTFDCNDFVDCNVKCLKEDLARQCWQQEQYRADICGTKLMHCWDVSNDDEFDCSEFAECGVQCPPTTTTSTTTTSTSTNTTSTLTTHASQGLEGDVETAATTTTVTTVTTTTSNTTTTTTTSTTRTTSTSTSTTTTKSYVSELISRNPSLPSQCLSILEREVACKLPCSGKIVHEEIMKTWYEPTMLSLQSLVPTTTTTTTIIVWWRPPSLNMEFTIAGLSYDLLIADESLVEAVKSEIKSMVVSVLSIGLEYVSVKLTAGSVVADVTIEVPKGKSASGLQIEMAQGVANGTWSGALGQSVANVPGISSASTHVPGGGVTVSVPNMSANHGTCTESGFVDFVSNLCAYPRWDSSGCGSLSGKCSGALGTWNCPADGCTCATAAANPDPSTCLDLLNQQITCLSPCAHTTAYETLNASGISPAIEELIYLMNYVPVYPTTAPTPPPTLAPEAEASIIALTSLAALAAVVAAVSAVSTATQVLRSISCDGSGENTDTGKGVRFQQTEDTGSDDGARGEDDDDEGVDEVRIDNVGSKPEEEKQTAIEAPKRSPVGEFIALNPAGRDDKYVGIGHNESPFKRPQQIALGMTGASRPMPNTIFIHYGGKRHALLLAKPSKKRINEIWKGEDDRGELVKLEHISSHKVVISGLSDEPLKLTRKIPEYAPFINYLPLLIILVTGILSLVFDDMVTGIILMVAAILGGLVAKLATRENTPVDRLVSSIGRKSPAVVWRGLGVMCALLPTVIAVISQSVLGYVIALLNIFCIIAELLGHRRSSSFARVMIVGLPFAVLGLVISKAMDPDFSVAGFEVVLAAALILANGLGRWATLTVAKMLDDNKFPERVASNVSAEEAASILGIDEDSAEAMLAFVGGSLGKVMRDRLVTALKQLVKAQANQAITVVHTVVRELVSQEAQQFQAFFASERISEVVRGVSDELHNEGLDLESSKEGSQEYLQIVEDCFKEMIAVACSPVAAACRATDEAVTEKLRTLRRAVEQVQGWIEPDPVQIILTECKVAERIMCKVNELSVASHENTHQLQGNLTSEDDDKLKEFVGSRLRDIKKYKRKLDHIRSKVVELPEGVADLEVIVATHTRAAGELDKVYDQLKETLGKDSVQGRVKFNKATQFQSQVKTACKPVLGFDARMAAQIERVPNVAQMAWQDMEDTLEELGLNEDIVFVEEFKSAQEAATSVIVIASCICEQLEDLLLDVRSNITKIENLVSHGESVLSNIEAFRKRFQCNPVAESYQTFGLRHAALGDVSHEWDDSVEPPNAPLPGAPQEDPQTVSNEGEEDELEQFQSQLVRIEEQADNVIARIPLALLASFEDLSSSATSGLFDMLVEEIKKPLRELLGEEAEDQDDVVVGTDIVPYVEAVEDEDCFTDMPKQVLEALRQYARKKQDKLLLPELMPAYAKIPAPVLQKLRAACWSTQERDQVVQFVE
jgi:hypothetical protein